MPAVTVSGVVESVRLERVKALGRVMYGEYEEPLNIVVTLETDDGDLIEVSTNVGRHKEGSHSVGDYTSNVQHDLQHNSEGKGYPWVIEGGGEVIKSLSPEVFRNAFTLQMKLAPTVWRGDRLTVRGSLVTKRGRQILQRARLLGLEREGQTWGATESVASTRSN